MTSGVVPATAPLYSPSAGRKRAWWGSTAPKRCSARHGAAWRACLLSSAIWRPGNRIGRGTWCSATPPSNGSTTTSAVLPRVVSWVAPGGVLAVQMPRNYHSPSHMAVGEVAASPRWSGLLEGVARKDPVAEPAVYLDLVGPLVDSIDLWETEYFHVLEGDDPVLNWLRATLLVPLLDALPLEQHEEFLDEVGENLRRIHPRRPDGTTLYPFRRLFLVATVGAAAITFGSSVAPLPAAAQGSLPPCLGTDSLLTSSVSSLPCPALYPGAEWCRRTTSPP